MARWRKAIFDSGALYEKIGTTTKIIFYKKGWFRGKQNKFVVSRLFRGTRKNKSFKTEKEAKAFIKRLIA